MRELRIVYVCRSDHQQSGGHIRVFTPREAFEAFAALLEAEPVEVVGLLCLATNHHLLCYHEVSRGVLDASLVHPREIFKPALLSNAAAVVIGHNHPSGDPTPSPNDVALTRRVVQAGQLLGIDVLDHIIVGHDRRYCSLRELGKLH